MDRPWDLLSPASCMLLPVVLSDELEGAVEGRGDLDVGEFTCGEEVRKRVSRLIPAVRRSEDAYLQG